ncbi:MAG: glycosyltransferase [Bryobacterales bacterium]|nr:glycosyltransferase [Bryobacterales bacterium]
MDGVSVVVCCHNSASRLPTALRHLSEQRGTAGVPWEVVVVDNASQDATAQVARDCWNGHRPAPLRVVHEPNPGLAHARLRGIAESRFEYITFVDDDNWVSSTWVAEVARVFTTYPDAGLCNGVSEAVCDQPLPPWFRRFQISYAVSPPDWPSEDVTSSRGWLWGAGLSLRRSAWNQLADAGWRWQLTGRLGSALSSGEDSELCLALTAAGWRLRYDRALRLQHHIDAYRLDWTYLRRLERSSGEASVIHDLYGERPSAAWWPPALSACKTALGASLAGLALLGPPGSWRVLSMDRHLGRLAALRRLRNQYPRLAAEIAETCRRLKAQGHPSLAR